MDMGVAATGHLVPILINSELHLYFKEVGLIFIHAAANSEEPTPKRQKTCDDAS
jgi:hypothetical protein